MTTNELSGEESGALADEHTREAITTRLEGMVSMGQPSCDACFSLSIDGEDHPEDAEFWPTPLTIFVNVEGDTLAEWMNTTVCDYHNPAIGDSDGVAITATHRVRAYTEYADDHNHNGARRYNVQSVKEVEE